MKRFTEKGFAYLELILSVVLVFIFIAIALKMLLRFSVDAEQVAVEEVVQTLGKAIVTLTAERLVDNDMAGLSRWHEKNPMDLLPIKPDNYAGKFTERDNKPDSGNWYFDYTSKKLVYGVKHKNSFQSGSGTKALVEYQLKFIYADNNGNGKFDAKHDKAQGLKLEPLGQYEWVR